MPSERERMSEEIVELGLQIQTLFEGVEATVCVAAMAELLAMQSVKVSANEAEAQDKLDSLHQMMDAALKLHAQKRWGRKH
jgi:hypothetical protein